MTIVCSAMPSMVDGPFVVRLGFRCRERDGPLLIHSTIDICRDLNVRKSILMAIAAVAVLAVAPLSVLLWFTPSGIRHWSLHETI